MDAVLSLLEKRRWDKYCRRTNIAKPDEIEGDTFRKARLMSNKLRANETELRSAIQKIAPEWHPDTDVILNKNVTCQRHQDKYNCGHSWMLWLGDFEGGALLFDDGSKIQGANKWHVFSGQDFHWNEPHTGTKYSIVLYRPTRLSVGQLIAQRRKEKHASLQAEARSRADVPAEGVPAGAQPPSLDRPEEQVAARL